MASKKELEAALRKRYGRELINLEEVTGALCRSRDVAARFVADLDSYQLGSSRKLYAISDIAAKLDREKRPGTYSAR